MHKGITGSVHVQTTGLEGMTEYYCFSEKIPEKLRVSIYSLTTPQQYDFKGFMQ